MPAVRWLSPCRVTISIFLLVLAIPACVFAAPLAPRGLPTPRMPDPKAMVVTIEVLPGKTVAKKLYEKPYLAAAGVRQLNVIRGPVAPGLPNVRLRHGTDVARDGSRRPYLAVVVRASQESRPGNYTLVLYDKKRKDIAPIRIVVRAPAPPEPPAGLRVISPNGGERWTIGEPHAIRWNKGGSSAEFVFIQLWNGDRQIGKVVWISSSGQHFKAIPNTGVYVWDTLNYLGRRCYTWVDGRSHCSDGGDIEQLDDLLDQLKVVVVERSSTPASDESDGSFVIGTAEQLASYVPPVPPPEPVPVPQNQRIHILAPPSGIHVSPGQRLVVRWTGGSGDSVQLKIRRDVYVSGHTEVSYLYSRTVPNAGSFEIVVPGNYYSGPGDCCRLVVRDVLNEDNFALIPVTIR